MKKVILIRHAKSSWDYNVDDRHRPLKEIGVENTLKVLKAYQNEMTILPEYVYTSPAKRAHDTCTIFLEHFMSPVPLSYSVVNELYDFGGSGLLSFIKHLDNDINEVFIFGHNNAITNIVNTYGDTSIANVPTSGLVVLEFDIDFWKDIKRGKTILKLFPKELNMH